MKLLDIKIPYWVGRRLGITLSKMNNRVYRLGIWKFYKLGKKYGSHKGEWGFNWWKFIDVGRGKDE